MNEMCLSVMSRLYQVGQREQTSAELLFRVCLWSDSVVKSFQQARIVLKMVGVMSRRRGVVAAVVFAL